MTLIKRWWLIALLALGLMLALYFRLYSYLNFQTLQTYHEQLTHWTQQHYFFVVSVFMLIYFIAVAISIPGALILTIVSGFLFGPVFGTLYVIISATFGACVIFLAVKSAMGDWLEKKARGWVSRVEAGFRKDAFNYLLFLRLVPVFPFWVVNVVPAIINIPLRVFFMATLLGIIPGTLVYVLIGNGLGFVLSSGQAPDLNIIFHPKVLLPIIALAILSLVPVLYRKLKGKKDD